MEQNITGRLNQDKQYETVIIDPTSPEVNRGSFCYLPYLLYSAIALKNKVWFMEDFTMAQIERVPKASEYIVALWSYPQIDLCLMLDKFLPKRPKFIGYEPLIKHLKLPFVPVTEDLLEEGMYNYPQVYPALQHLLLSDCDMHLKKYEGQVYPLFTSYGCPRGCAFCPSTINCNKKRTVLDIQDVEMMLDICIDRGVRNIHFTDEDFFFQTDRAAQILQHTAKIGGFNFIALGEVTTVNRFIDNYGNDLLKASGMKLIEIGMETADEELGKKMGKSPVVKCQELAEKCEIDIFWLALTFFPGETLETLNETGKFLKQHGFKPEELYGRIRTNGTEGGLGQFFQPYHGTKDYSKLRDIGMFISPRPMRLLPSYLPNSFLNSPVTVKNGLRDQDLNYWCNIYRVKSDLHLVNNRTVRGHIQHNQGKGISIADSAIYYAICARLGII